MAEWQGWKEYADGILEVLDDASYGIEKLRTNPDFATNDYVDAHLTEMQLLIDQVRVQWRYAKLARENR